MKTKPRSREYERALSANNNIHEDIGHIYRSLPLSGNGMLQLSEDRKFLPAQLFPTRPVRCLLLLDLQPASTTLIQPGQFKIPGKKRYENQLPRLTGMEYRHESNSRKDSIGLLTIPNPDSQVPSLECLSCLKARAIAHY